MKKLSWRVFSAYAVCGALVLLVLICVVSEGAAQRIVTKTRNGLLVESGRSELVSQLNLYIVFTANAFNPGAVNSAILADVKAQKKPISIARKYAILNKLGWRNTASLQRQLLRAAERSDWNRILDLADALLRRDQLTVQTLRLLVEFEKQPSLHKVLVAKLAENPPWRRAFFSLTARDLGSRAADSRGEFVVKLYSQGIHLDRVELAGVLNYLVGENRESSAFEIWALSNRAAIKNIVYDENFSHGYTNKDLSVPYLPFEWRTYSGIDFDSGFSLMDRGASATLNINWSGIGSPIFAAQKISLPKSSRRLVLRVLFRNSNQQNIDLLDFVLACPLTTYPFYRTEVAVTSNGQSWKAMYDLPNFSDIECRFPELRIQGSLRERNISRNYSSEPISLEISYVQLFDIN